jgi:hypothetical protein
LDGHRLSDFSEGTLVSCAKGSLPKGGWMDGRNSEAAFFFYWRNVAKKRNIYLKKLENTVIFEGFHRQKREFFLGVQIARLQ